MLNLLRADSINVNLKTHNEPPLQEKAIDYCNKDTVTLKLLLQIGQLRAEDAKDHVTRLIDRGLNLQKDNDLNNALANYRVANLLLKEFGAATEDSMRQLLRCLKCLENVSQAMNN